MNIELSSHDRGGRRLVLLGVGNVATAVKAASGHYEQVAGTTRSANKIAILKSRGIEALLLGSAHDPALADLLVDADVLVSFPPDRESDLLLSVAAHSARRIIYISSTGVYGRITGPVDESTAVDSDFPQAAARLEAEKVWLAKGAIVLRAPGLYGPNTGLHVRLRDQTYRLPGDGRNHISRIHLDDLAQIIVAAFSRGDPGSLYVVGDRMPSPQIEVVTWLCEKMAIPLPPSVPLDQVSPTLRGNRRVIADKILSDLALTLLFPSYKEGFSQCLAVLGSTES